MRLLVYALMGFSLLFANYWYIELLRNWLLTDEFIIAPFNITQRELPDEYDRLLAQMLAARLTNLQYELQQARETVKNRQSHTHKVESRSQPRVTTLFVSQAVEIPTDLLRPVQIQASVGGVEVGGVFAWLQSTLIKQRTLTFTVLESGEKVVISSDLRGFSKVGTPNLFFESEATPDEIVTNIAYALIQRKLSQDPDSQIAKLPPKDFRTLLESVLEVEQLNKRVLQGYVVDDEFLVLLPDIERLSEKAPQWHQLSFLAGNIAESAGNQNKAIQYYERVQYAIQQIEADTPQVSIELANWVSAKLESLGTVPKVGSMSQRDFISTAKEFADLMGFTDRDPIIEFKQSDHAGLQALWNAESGRFEVNVDNIDTPGLPQYVAIMGRFMERNYQRCIVEQVSGQGTDFFEFWNEFRNSIVDYLIQSVPAFSQVNLFSKDYNYKLFQALKEMEKDYGVDNVQRLALELLKQYDCDWSQANISDKIIEVNRERGFLPEEVIRKVF